MTADGRISNLLELWTPWWNVETPLVAEIESPVNPALPKMLPNIPKLSEILKVQPSSDVKFNVINVLYAYAYVTRLHNGNHIAMATESCQDVLEISDVLSKGHSCGSVEEAVQVCLKNITNARCSFESTNEWNLKVIHDVEKVITGYTSNPLLYPMSALSDLHLVFKNAYKTVQRQLKDKSTKSDTDNLTKEKSSLFQCVKKCEFMLSWCQTYGMALEKLVPELNLVHSLLQNEYQSMDSSKKKLETRWGGAVKPQKKKLVQEL